MTGRAGRPPAWARRHHVARALIEARLAELGLEPPPRDIPADVLAATSTEPATDLSVYQGDTLRFIREVLGITVWEGMERITAALKVSDRVAVRSGHKVSKSTTAAAVALHRAACIPGSRTVLTAPSSRQVEAIIWRELKLRHAAAGLPGRVYDKPRTGYAWNGAEVFGFSTDDADRMSGISGPDLLFIIDEASGMLEQIMEAIEGNLAGGGKILMLSNPTQTSGTFYRAFTTERDLWTTIHISSTDSPNVRAGRVIIPGLATREYVEQRRRAWGEESPLFQVRVLGNFPKQSESAVVGLGLVEAGRARFDDYHREQLEREVRSGAVRLTVGVDCARYGDDPSFVAPLLGTYAPPGREFRGMDGPQLAGHIMNSVQDWRAEFGAYNPVRVKIDIIGVGASVFDSLRYSDRAAALQIEAVAVNVAEAATHDGFALIRDQIWFALADWLRNQGGTLPPDPELEAELVAPVYTFDARGRQKVESQDDIKAKLGHSPDRANALGLALFDPPDELRLPTEPRQRGWSGGAL